MVQIKFDSLGKKKGGGFGALLMGGVAIGVIALAGFAVFNWGTAASNELSHATGFNLLGTNSSIEGDAQGNNAVVSLAGSLGKGNYPYSTVTFSETVKDGVGAVMPSLTQYVFDEQPGTWGKVLNIADDLTTPHGVNGQAIGIPQASTVTNGVLTATLGTAPLTTDKAGNVVVTDKTYYVYASIANAPDLFFKVDVPNAGAVDATTPTITLPNYTNPLFDKTAWTSSAIDLGLAGNATGTVMYSSTTYRVKDANVVQVGSIKMTDLNKLGNAGALGYIKVNFDGLTGGEWKPYDYSASHDEFAYDGSYFTAVLNGSDRNPATGILGTIQGGANVNLQVEVKANAGSSANALQNGEILGELIIKDIEGNTLVDQNVTG